MTTPAGWTAAAIREAIRARGTTIYRLAKAHGFRQKNALAISLVARNRQPKAHRIIADFLGLSLHELWPHWYEPGKYRDTSRDRKTPADVFERILERIARGERLAAICREAGQPSGPTIRAYCKANPRFWERWIAAMGRRRGVPVPAAAAIADEVLERAAAGERVSTMPLADRHVVARRRRLDPEFAARWRETLSDGRSGARLSRSRAERVLAAVQAGQLPKKQRVASYHAVMRLRAIDAAFAARFTAARRQAAATAIRSSSTRQLSPAEVWRVVEDAVRNVPFEARDDIRGDLMVALLEGRVAPEAARPAARELMTAWNRQFARRDISMDAEIGDGLTLAGIVSDGSFDASGTGIRVTTIQI